MAEYLGEFAAKIISIMSTIGEGEWVGGSTCSWSDYYYHVNFLLKLDHKNNGYA